LASRRRMTARARLWSSSIACQSHAQHPWHWKLAHHDALAPQHTADHTAACQSSTRLAACHTLTQGFMHRTQQVNPHMPHLHIAIATISCTAASQALHACKAYSKNIKFLFRSPTQAGSAPHLQISECLMLHDLMSAACKQGESPH
jgi:hypothetical protein